MGKIGLATLILVGETISTPVPSVKVVSIDHVQAEVLPPPPPEPTLEEKILAGDNSTTTIKQFIEEEAARLGVDPKLASRIAECESGFQFDIKNPKSTAQGTYQFVNSTWNKTLERMGLPTTTPKTDAVIGVKAGVWLLKEDGARQHWEESYPCFRHVYEK